MNDNPKQTSTIAAIPRCQHRFANNMRCSVPLEGRDVQFCSRHTKLPENQPVEQDLSAFLLKGSQDFQTAQGINYSLANLFDLLAQNRISARRAAVLAYVASLLLRTHPAIDADRKANILDPTANWSGSGPDPKKKPS